MRTAAWTTGILAIIISLVAGSRPCFAATTATGTRDTGYRITSTDQVIDVWGVCKNIKSSSSDLFAPTKTSGEWNPFLSWSANNASRVTLTACATCSDGIQNQGETGVDCGGPCPACGPAPTCSDGIQNQGETGVDCGGPCAACPSCGDAICNGGETCASCPGDCGACPPVPTCSDGIQNQGETGVDCGGPCAACPPSPVCDVPQHFSCFPSGTTCGADDWGRQLAGCSGGCGDDSSQNSIAFHWDNATGQGQCWWDARPVNPPYTFATFGECNAQRDACWPH